MERNLGWLMNRAGLSWRTVVDRYMADLGLTQTRWVTMLVLSKTGEGCTQTVLATQVGVEHPSLVRTLAQLEEAGLIERRLDPDDGRRRTVWFTATGKELLVRMEQVASLGREQLLKGISAEQRQNLHDLLEIIINNAHALIEEEEAHHDRR